MQRIDASSYDDPWTEKHFDGYMQRRSTWGYVATQGRDVIAYTLFDERHYGLRIDRIAVSPMNRRRGVGRGMVDALIGEVCLTCAQVRAYVPEEMLDAQLFFKQLGFLAAEPFIVQRGFPERNCFKMIRSSGPS